MIVWTSIQSLHEVSHIIPDSIDHRLTTDDSVDGPLIVRFVRGLPTEYVRAGTAIK
jgi:hypothetical protein